MHCPGGEDGHPLTVHRPAPAVWSPSPLTQRPQTEPPDDIPATERRGGAAPWSLGQSPTSPQPAPSWMPGMGTAARGNPRTRSPRVASGANPWTPPSGSRMAPPHSGLARPSTQSMEPLGKAHLPPGGMLLSPAGSHNPAGAASIGQAMPAATSPPGKSRRGDRPPAWPNGWAPLFSLLIYLNYDLGGVWALEP